MPFYDFTCDHCGYNQVNHFQSAEAREFFREDLVCESCGEKGRMVLKPSAPNFSVKGFNAGNGYSKP